MTISIYNHTGCKVVSDEYDVYAGKVYVPTTEWVLPTPFLRRYMKDTSSIFLISPQYADIPNRPNCVRVPLGLVWDPSNLWFTFGGLSVPSSDCYDHSHLKDFGTAYKKLKDHVRYLAALYNCNAHDISELYQVIDSAPLEMLVHWTVDLQAFQRDMLKELTQ